MHTIRYARSAAPAGTLAALCYATVIVAALDLIEVSLYYGLFKDVGPLRIGQSIASGLFGAAAYRGGLTMAIVGALLHTAIMGVIVGCYHLAASNQPLLRRHWSVFGAAFGIVVYVVMNGVVVPLSAAVVGARTLDVVVNGLFAHVCMVGMPTAWLVARIQQRGVPL